MRDAPEEGETLPKDSLEPAHLLMPGIAALGVLAAEMMKATNEFASTRRRERSRRLVSEDGERLDAVLRYLRLQLSADTNLPGSYKREALTRLHRAEQAFWRCAEDPEKVEVAEGYLQNLERYAGELSSYLDELPRASYYRRIEDIDEREGR